MPDDVSNLTKRRTQIKLREEMGGEPAFFGPINRGLYGMPLKGKPASEVEGTKDRQRQQMEDISTAVGRPGQAGPDPTNRKRLRGDIVNTRAGNFHGGIMGQRSGRSAASADVALPHMAHGVQRNGADRDLPPMAHAPNRAPPKLGAYPAPLAAANSHGYGHDATQRRGHLRTTGHSGAHQIGRR